MSRGIHYERTVADAGGGDDVSLPVAFAQHHIDRYIEFRVVAGGTFKIQGSHDNAAWADIETGINAAAAPRLIEQNYKYYRVVRTAAGGGVLTWYYDAQECW